MTSLSTPEHRVADTNRTLLGLAKAPNGFNTIRLIAAIIVLFSHSFPLTGAAEPLQMLTNQTTFGELSVAVFFAISGYLIPMSYDRSSLGQYAVKRTQRLLPALAVAVLVCALILGPVVTDLSVGRYFTSFGTYKFLGNAVFLPVGYDLPGVFTANPMASVNGSLWSLKFEVACYVFVVVAFVIKPWRKKAVLAAWILSFLIVQIIPEPVSGLKYYVRQMAELFRFFGTGMILYLYADKIPVSKFYGWAALAISIAAIITPLFLICASTFGVYALFVFSYNCPEWFRDLTRKGDISYGVYVYAFPVQQLLVPVSLALAARFLVPAPYLNSLLSLVPVLILGALSWVLVEKPFLSRTKRRLVGVAATDLPRRAAQGSDVQRP